MTSKSETRANKFATAALIVVITAASVSLAAFTDIQPLARWSISIFSGIVAAAVTFELIKQRIKVSQHAGVSPYVGLDFIRQGTKFLC